MESETKSSNVFRKMLTIRQVCEIYGNIGRDTLLRAATENDVEFYRIRGTILIPADELPKIILHYGRVGRLNCVGGGVTDGRLSKKLLLGFSLRFGHIRPRTGERGVAWQYIYTNPETHEKQCVTFPAGTSRHNIKLVVRRTENKIEAFKIGLDEHFQLTQKRLDKITIGQLADKFMNDQTRQRNLKATSLREQRYSCQRFVNTVGANMPVATFTSKNYIENFVDIVIKERTDRRLSRNEEPDEQKIKRGVNGDLQSIKAMFAWGLDFGLITPDMKPEIKLIKVDKKSRPYILSESQLLDLENALHGNEKMAFQILRYTFARRREVLKDGVHGKNGLRWRDIYWMRHEVKLDSKGKARNVPLKDRLERALKKRQIELGLSYDDNAFVINETSMTIYRRIIAGMKKIGIYRKGNALHLIRRSAATDLYEKTGDIKLLKELLGHSDLKTTEDYVYASGEKLQRGMAAL